MGLFFVARIRQNCAKILVYFALNILYRQFFLGVLVNFLCLAPSFYFIGVSNVKRPLVGAFFSFVSTTQLALQSRGRLHHNGGKYCKKCYFIPIFLLMIWIKKIPKFFISITLFAHFILHCFLISRVLCKFMRSRTHNLT